MDDHALWAKPCIIPLGKVRIAALYLLQIVFSEYLLALPTTPELNAYGLKLAPALSGHGGLFLLALNIFMDLIPVMQYISGYCIICFLQK